MQTDFWGDTWRRFMACQKRYFYWLLLSCLVLTLFSGCPGLPPPPPPPPPEDESRPIAVTKGIINRVNADDQKKPKPKDFQYYISKGITLRLIRSNEQFTVESGKLVITKQTKREQITIEENLHGLIYADVPMTDDNGYLLDVHFEEKYPDCFITFHQTLPGDNEKYSLLYHDIKTKTIKYGDDYYTVTVDGVDPEDPPYLFIKMNTSDTSATDERKASGIKLP
jgi:hypothetical protein